MVPLILNIKVQAGILLLRAAPPAPVAAAGAQTLEDQVAELKQLSDQDVEELLGGI